MPKNDKQKEVDQRENKKNITIKWQNGELDPIAIKE